MECATAIPYSPPLAFCKISARRPAIAILSACVSAGIRLTDVESPGGSKVFISLQELELHSVQRVVERRCERNTFWYFCKKNRIHRHCEFLPQVIEAMVGLGLGNQNRRVVNERGDDLENNNSRGLVELL